MEVLIPTDSSVVVESFRNGTLDLGYLSSTDAARNLNQNTASILLIHLKTAYLTTKVSGLVSKNKSYQSINELKGAPVAFASRSSTSGYLIPVWDLSNRGLVGAENSLSDFFSLTIYGTGYVSAVEKVLSGEVEAAAVSDYVFLGDNKYLNDSQKSRLQIIQQQGPVPSHTICARSTLSDSDRKILKETLLAMNHDATSLRDQVFNGELMEVDAEEHLRITREAIEVQKSSKTLAPALIFGFTKSHELKLAGDKGSLGFFLSGRWLFRNLNYPSPPSTFVAITGPSGVGKPVFFGFLPKRYFPRKENHDQFD